MPFRPLDQRACGRGGRGVQLAGKQRLQLAIQPPCHLHVAGRQMEAHGLPVGLLPQRVGLHPAHGILDRAMNLASLLQRLDQLPERLVILLGEPPLLRRNPFLIEAGQKLPLVESHCPLEQLLS